MASSQLRHHLATRGHRLSLLTNLGPPPSSTLLSEFSYPLYNPEGDILQWSQARGVPPDGISYDDARQLKIFGLKPNGTGDFQFNYDDAGNLQSELRPTWSRTYTHNTTNAITPKRVETGLIGWTVGPRAPKRKGHAPKRGLTGSLKSREISNLAGGATLCGTRQTAPTRHPHAAR